ncbi:hypothetical protein HLH44_18950 [Gluconacetobacter sp. 1c LMG 22058]|uniref:Uncharacterized protein n=1 Tax=Gluconacetobacter dulcium TaxID=2729096 RepID=A0A7W4K327_9PROT|nr:hypothetical protein [Gluconacetobacter dulcium]
MIDLHRLAGIAVVATSVAGCAHGNIRSVASYHPPPPPHVKQPLFDPYAPYGSAPAVWRPALASRAGTIVKPNDPVDQADRPSYETSAWSIDQKAAKAGTF